MKIQVEFFWVVTQYSVVVGYQRFRGPCCLHLQAEVAGRQAVMVLLTDSQSVSRSWLRSRNWDSWPYVSFW
jgi:hypothetical protein